MEEIPLKSWLNNEKLNRGERIPWVTKWLHKKFSVLREFSFNYWHHKMCAARIFSQFHRLVMQNFLYVFTDFLETNSNLTFLAVGKLALFGLSQCFLFNHRLSELRGPGSSVGIATDYGLDGPGIEFRWGEIFSRPDRPWGPPSLLYNGYRIFPGGTVRRGRAADHSHPSSAAVMEE